VEAAPAPAAVALRFLSAAVHGVAIAVAIAIGSQEPLSLGHLLATTSQPVAWLGLLGTLLVAGELLRGRVDAPQSLAYLTLVLWALVLFLGSRTPLSGFPQRFERDLGIPLAALAALAFIAILRSAWPREPAVSPTASLKARLATVLVSTLAVVVVVLSALGLLGDPLHRVALAVTIIVGALTWSAAEIVTSVRRRQPLFDAAREPS